MDKTPKIKNVLLAQALLKGEVITIMDGFKRFGITNAPREISRSIQKKFGVLVSKDKVEFKTDLGLPGYYFRYRLNHTQMNAAGFEKMRQYVEEYLPSKKKERIIAQTLF